MANGCCLVLCLSGGSWLGQDMHDSVQAPPSSDLWPAIRPSSGSAIPPLPPGSDPSMCACPLGAGPTLVQPWSKQQQEYQ